jgi:hypothetical protein|tara:strand:- start:411 stop:671 length:261 start_codon:yes stop_codon:yes gene_type:complete
MLIEFSSLERFATNVALNLDFRAMLLNMVSQLGSGHVLEFLEVANVTSVLRALIVLSMLLQLSHSLPKDFTIRGLVAFMRELAEVH